MENQSAIKRLTEERGADNLVVVLGATDLEGAEITAETVTFGDPSFAGPLGGMYNAAHGALCAGLLPYVMEANVKALQSRASKSPALSRYDEVARIITGAPTSRAADGITWVKNLCLKLHVQPLAVHGITETDLSAVVTKSQKASSMQGNPIALTALGRAP